MHLLTNAFGQNGLSCSRDEEDAQWVSIHAATSADQERRAQQASDLLQGRLPLEEPIDSLGGPTPSRNSAFPLTDIQYAYLIGRNKGLELSGVPSSIYLEWDLSTLNLTVLNEAFNRVIQQHPMLRAILSDGGQQAVLADLPPYLFSIEDCRGLTDIQINSHLEQTRRDLEQTTKPLDQPFSFEVRVTRLNNSTDRLHLYFDLMFLDIPSVRIVFRDWWREYQNPGPLKLSATPTFKEYVEAEQRLRDRHQGQRDHAYWNARIDAFPPAPELPLKQSPGLIAQPEFKRLSRVVSPGTLDALRVAATERGLTLETVLLGAYAEVVRQWSRHQSFTLTLTHTGRRSFFNGVDSLVGNFLQPELLAVRGQPEESLTERWVQLQTDMLRNRWHSSFNGVQVLRELTRRGQNHRTASAPVVFSNTLTAHLDDRVPDIGWESARTVHSSSRTPQVWLENQIVREDKQLCIHWNYVDELFPEGQVEQMLEGYLGLLSTCATDPHLWDAQGSVIPLSEEDQAARCRANQTQIDLNLRPLHEAVRLAAERYPETIAVVQGERQLSYRDLLNEATRLAVRIRETLILEKGDILAVCLPQGPDLLIGILGVLFAGGAYVALDPAWPSQRRERLLMRCQAKAVVGTPTTFPNMEDFPDTARFQVEAKNQSAISTEPLPIVQSLDDLAYVIFTSGSTGEPKGVMVSHRNAANTVQDINRRFEVTSEDVVLSIAPAGFDLSVYDYFGLLSVGGRVVFQASAAANDPHQWAREVSAQGVTLWNSVPAPMKVLIDQCGPELSTCSLRLILMSGDWIPVDLPGRIRQWLPKTRIISLGGATEGSIWSICYPIDRVDDRWTSIPYGKPLANQAFHVLNEWLEPCPGGVVGELYIAGTGVAQGYLGDPEKTRQRFINHPRTGERLYKTGDLGCYLEDGVIEILGREDNQVKINGYRVELGEIEACLLGHEDAGHVVIDAPCHPKTGQRQIIAYVVAGPGRRQIDVSAFVAQLKTLATQNLPAYMVPSYFVTLPEMPLTPNGKIDRKALPAPWGNLTDDDPGQVEPENDIQRRLLVLWQQQLQHRDIDVSQGFFDVGGDSLHAVGLLGAIREVFAMPASAEQAIIEGLFMNASIQTFAGIIEELMAPSGVSDS